MFLHCSKLCKFLSYLWLLFDEVDRLHMVFAFEFACPSSTSLIFFLKVVALEPFFSLGKHIKTNSPKEYYAKFWFPHPWFPTILAVYLFFFFVFFPCLSVTNLRATRAELHLRKLCKLMGLYSMKNVIKFN